MHAIRGATNVIYGARASFVALLPGVQFCCGPLRVVLFGHSKRRGGAHRRGIQLAESALAVANEGADDTARCALVISSDADVVLSAEVGLARHGIATRTAHSVAGARLLYAEDARAPEFEMVCVDTALVSAAPDDVLGELTRWPLSPKLALLVRFGARAIRVLPIFAVPEPGDYAGLVAPYELPDANEETAAFCARHGLSGRESTLLELAVQGLNNDEAAAFLGCNRCTVGTYWSRIFRKTRTNGQRDVLGKLLRARYAREP